MTIVIVVSVIVSLVLCWLVGYEIGFKKGLLAPMSKRRRENMRVIQNALEATDYSLVRPRVSKADIRSRRGNSPR